MPLLHFSMSAAMSHPGFIQVRQKLISKLGPKLPLDSMLSIIVRIETNTGLRADRSVKRSRDKIIGWLADNWAKAGLYIEHIKNHHNRCNNREMQKNNERINRAWGKIKVVNDTLEQILGKQFNMQTLLRYAESITKEFNITLDRSAKRNKKILLSWFCENWAKVSNVVEKDLNNGVAKALEVTARNKPPSPVIIHKSEIEKEQSSNESPGLNDMMEQHQDHEFKFIEVGNSEFSFDFDESQPYEMLNFTEISNLLDDDLHVSANNVFDYIEEYSLDFRKYF